MVGLQLVASKIAKDLGKYSDDGMQVSEIQSVTSLNPKSVSSRLSELVKAGYVIRENTRDENESVVYRITTSGIHWFGIYNLQKDKILFILLIRVTIHKVVSSECIDNFSLFQVWLGYFLLPYL